MSQLLYLNCSETTTGPFAVEELRARHTAGTLPPDALIHDGQAWLPGDQLLNRPRRLLIFSFADPFEEGDRKSVV